MTSQTVPRVSDGVGHLTLDRPEALNALSYALLGEVAEQLAAWRSDPAVRVVVLDGGGERGLCAGGDIRELYGSLTAGRPDRARRYFRREYRLDAVIAEYPKPVVALMDGITMGGGVGLSGHAAIRVVTERSRMAMPETRIGFTPDVGGTWLLGRAPGRLGEYLGLGAVTMSGADAIAAGFADHYVASDRLGDLVAALGGIGADPAGRAGTGVGHAGASGTGVGKSNATGTGVEPADAAGTGAGARAEVEARVRAVAEEPPASDLLAQRERIDRCYAADTVPEIVARLRAAERAGDTASGREADALEQLSPTSLTVLLPALRRARELPDLRAVLAQEYGLVCWFVDTQPDLPEGIRAQVIDKDRAPRWRPATLAEVDPGLGERALGYVPPEPLW